MSVKLETTKRRRRLHIGSFFVDLNETDYKELINIFGKNKKKILIQYQKSYLYIVHPLKQRSNDHKLKH